jgi:hypothetical protein
MIISLRIFMAGTVSVACACDTLAGNGDVGILAPMSGGASVERDAATAARGDAEADANTHQPPAAFVTPAPEPLCLKNPSFEGSPALSATPPGWSTCTGTPDTAPVAPLTSLTPTAGSSFLALQAGQNTESVSSALCARGLQQPLRFAIDLTLMPAPLVLVVGTVLPPSMVLEVWGGAQPCAMEQLLWTSPQVTLLQSWQTVCGELPQRPELRFVTLRPLDTSPPSNALTNTGVSMLLGLDNLRAADACSHQQ